MKLVIDFQELEDREIKSLLIWLKRVTKPSVLPSENVAKAVFTKGGVSREGNVLGE